MRWGLCGGLEGMNKHVAEVAGTVRQQLPNAMFRIELDTRHQILAHASADIGRNFIRLLAGDRVLVQVSPLDPTRGRIVRRV